MPLERESPPGPHDVRRIRQKRTIQVLAGALMAGGLAMLFLLQRMPLPLRLFMGLLDVFAGLGLLVLVRQKFPR